jgi:hypothetical protein
MPVWTSLSKTVFSATDSDGAVGSGGREYSAYTAYKKGGSRRRLKGDSQKTQPEERRARFDGIVEAMDAELNHQQGRQIKHYR